MINRFLLLPLILVGCTAPVTDPPAHAFELEIEESQWQYVYDAIEYIKRGEREKKMTDPSISNSNACAGGSVTGAVHPTNIKGNITNLFILF